MTSRARDAAVEHLRTAIELLDDLASEALGIAASLPAEDRRPHLVAERTYAKARNAAAKALALVDEVSAEA